MASWFFMGVFSDVNCIDTSYQDGGDTICKKGRCCRDRDVNEN